MPWVEPIARRAAWVTIAAVVIGFLVVANEVVIPIALAILLAFMLSPIVRWLNRHVRSRLLSVTLASAVGGLLLAGVTTAATMQFLDFAEQLPSYRHTISKKLIAIRGTSEGVVGRALRAMGDIERDVESASKEAPTADKGTANIPAIPVVAREQVGLFESTRQTLEPWIHPLVTASVVAVLVVLLLLWSEDLRDRIVVLAGTHQISITAQALEDASKRIGRYLLMQACVNAFFGTSIAIGLFLIGLPNAILLGLLAGVLRFVPLLGAWLGALVPVLLAMAVFDHWNGVLMVAGLFIVFEAIVNLILEPWLYGHSTGISGVAVIVAILFWTWVWGPIGLLLAMPITVCLVVLGKYLEPLRVFYILLSDEPMLSGERQLYHRLVTGDFVSASSIVEQSLSKNPRAEVVDELLLPVLRTARADHAAGTLSEERANLVSETIQDLISDPTGGTITNAPRGSIACTPVEAVDRPVGYLVAATMARAIGRTVPLHESSMLSDITGQIDACQTSTLVLVCGSSESVARARLLAKALLTRLPELRLFVADLSDSSRGGLRDLGLSGVTVVDSVKSLVEKIEQISRVESVTERVGTDAPSGNCPDAVPPLAAQPT